MFSTVLGSWLSPQVAPVLLAILVVAGIGTGLLFGVALAAYGRRRSRAYLLLAIALGLLFGRCLVGLGTVFGITPMLVHHVVGHGIDFVIALFVLYVGYSTRLRGSR